MSADLTTKDGVIVAVGQTWQDCDRRMSGRKARIVELGSGKNAGKVRVIGITHDGREWSPKRWLSVRRMHRHSTGWILVEPTP